MQNGNCENFIEFYLKKKQDLIDDEPTKKQVYLTFYRKFPNKNRKKMACFDILKNNNISIQHLNEFHGTITNQ